MWMVLGIVFGIRNCNTWRQVAYDVCDVRAARIMMEEKAFAVVTKDSVRLMAETAGHNNVPDDIAILIGEDVSYRLREAVMKSAAFMKNSKRRRLCPEDFNQALRGSDVQPVFGHSSSTDSSPFRQTREGELHFVEDAEVSFNNAVCNSYFPKSLGKASIKGQWMAVEGVNKLSSLPQNTHYSQSMNKTLKKDLPDELMNYYNQVTQALVGPCIVLVKCALEDLSTNASVVPLLPYFINFVASGVKAVSHDVSKLTLLMRTVESLVQNQALFLETQPYLSLLVQALESCLLEPLAAYINHQSMDHWMLRQYAAHLLAKIIRKWNNRMNRLHSATVDRFMETLQDLTRPLCSHYGAIMGLIALGSAEVERVLVPQLTVLLPHIRTTMNDLHLTNHRIRFDAFKVHGALKLAVEKLMRTQNKEFQDLCKQPEDTRSTDDPVVQYGRGMLALYQHLNGHFGDTLSVQLPVLELDKVFGGQPSYDYISLGDCESKRSGEELLSDLMHQVQQQEQEHRYSQQQHQCLDIRKNDEAANHLQQRRSHSADSEVDDTEPVHPSRSMYNPSDDSKGLECGSGFEEQLAVTSTISDPTKGTLKLKIRRHTQGQSSPSQPRLTLQINKAWTEPEQRQYRDMWDKELRHKRKRKQSSRNPWEQGTSDLGETPDLEDSYGHQLSSQPAHVYSSGGESSGSESNLHKKGKLMLKLKVPSKESASE